MSEKAVIIKKDVILITRVGDSVIIEYFDECRLFRGTHSIKKERWTYYCKSDKYYCTDSYCLIIDDTIKDEAFTSFCDCVRNKLEHDILEHERCIGILSNSIKHINKFEYETNI